MTTVGVSHQRAPYHFNARHCISGESPGGATKLGAGRHSRGADNDRVSIVALAHCDKQSICGNIRARSESKVDGSA